MLWLTDTYVVTAGDAAAAYVGRGYNAGKGQFESVTAGDLSSSYASRDEKLRLKSAQLWLATTGGVAKRGVIARLYRVYDGQATWQMTPLLLEVHGAQGWVLWTGDTPLFAGVIWRVFLGGLQATDIVRMQLEVSG